MASVTIPYRFRVRRRSAASWVSLNEVLLSAEIGLETDTGLIKIGDGVTAWNSLLYANLGPIDLAALSDGVVPTWDAALGKWIMQAGGAGGAISPANESRFFDDFMGKPPTLTTTEPGTDSNWTADTITGGIAQLAATTQGRGIWRLTTGTGATNATIFSRGDGVNNILLGQGEYADEWRIGFPSLSTALQRFVGIVGLTNNFGGSPTAQVTVRYADNENSGRFYLFVQVGGVTTVYNGTTPIVAGTMYRVKIEVNAAGTEAYLYVNDLLEATATSIPTVAMRAGAWLNSLVGTTPKSMDLDYYNHVETFTTAR